ncbi:hypothetical protein EXU57_12140 [Segetibacter sp. 3557_3]|uniref:anti-sigma factor family protein n=1 Tax=Segetibacter sp. 3557_3 TaxID=2547429 RepID=UPI001058BE6E|nr:hypothetical protein [Segetibacter sp. 3557_3]TDH26231.1 hypothetical protein EXU57_12140 [Segetibacter sp. 3557_3]
MEINRQTYETFLLLYIDNELEPAERAAVEKFLLHNPDLQPELELLQQAVLEEPAVDFANKSTLYRNAEGISSANYETYFLLYVDNELSASEGQQVEQFVLQHPHLQEGFTLLRRTRLEPDVLEFKDKALLLREESTERRVVYMNWFRIASAAAVFGLAVLLWFAMSPSAIDTTLPIAAVTERVSQPATVSPDTVNPLSGSPDEPSTNTDPVASTTRSKGVVAAKSIKKKPVEDQLMPSNVQLPTPVATSTELALQPKSNNLPQRGPVIAQAEHPADHTADAIAYTSAPTNTSNDATLRVQHAAYRESDEQEEEQTLYIGAAGINRNKLRGLLKKASNLFERKLKRDDDGNSVQVANFEIKTN